MIVMQVCNDKLANALRCYAQQIERGGGPAHEPPAALCRHRLVEAGIDEQEPFLVPDNPDEVVHRHRHIVGIAADEMIRPPAVAFGILECKNLIRGRRHRASGRFAVSRCAGTRIVIGNPAGQLHFDTASPRGRCGPQSDMRPACVRLAKRPAIIKTRERPARAARPAVHDA